MSSPTARPRVLLLLTLFVVSLAMLGRPPSSSYAAGGFSPNQELPLPLLAGQLPVRFIVRGLEPSVRVAPDGTVYVASIRGVPGGVDLHRYYAAADGPANGDGTYPFKYEGRPDGCGIFKTPCDATGLAEGGGDVDIAVNYPTTGVPNLALTSLTLAPGITSTHSTNRGDSFSQPNPVAPLIPGDDRQWMDGIDGSTVYLSYHDVPSFNIEVQRSNDGGQTYVQGFGEAIDAATFPAAGGVPASNSANVLGSVRVDRGICPSRGNVYQIFIAPDNLAENLGGQPLRTVYVGVSTDAKTAPGPLPAYTFADTKIWTGPVGSENLNLFPALSVDAFGNVYAVWSNRSYPSVPGCTGSNPACAPFAVYTIWYSYSTDQGTTWATPPIQVNSGGTVGNANVFPWMDADANGHVSIVWFGADRAGDSNSRPIMEPNHDPSQGGACTDSTNTCMNSWAKWSVYHAETVNGHDATPVFTQNVISDHPIHRGTISTGGLGGNSDRSLADYFQVAFDPLHRANVAFSDDHKVSPLGPNNGEDNPTTRRFIRANFTHELMPTPGIVTTNGICAAPPPPETGHKITGGGRLFPNVSFGFVAKDTPLNGALQYQDPDFMGGIKVHSQNGIASVTFAPPCATFDGSAKLNQQPGYSFRVTACDMANPGAGKDTFTIHVFGPNGFFYSKEGTLTEGNIVLH